MVRVSSLNIETLAFKPSKMGIEVTRLVKDDEFWFCGVQQ